MATENTDVVRRFKEAINARDAETWASLVAPDFDFRSVFVGVEGRPYRGPEGGARYLADLHEAFEHVHIEIDDMQDLEDGRVLTEMRIRTRGRASGVETVVPLASVSRVQDGRLVSYQTYTDLDEGRAAANDHGELARILLDRFNTRDLDGWMAHATPDVEVESRFALLVGRRHHGRDGVAAWWRDLTDSFDDIQTEFEGSADTGPDETALLMTIHATGRASGLQIHERVALRVHWEDRRLARMEYIERDEAERIVRGR